MQWRANPQLSEASAQAPGKGPVARYVSNTRHPRTAHGVDYQEIRKLSRPNLVVWLRLIV